MTNEDLIRASLDKYGSIYFTEAGGRFMQLLPKKEGEELPTILH
jgi:hypothetical protein